MTEISCTPDGHSRRIAIAVARFNSPITELLLEGCRAALIEHGVDASEITVVRVPGAWELPLVCRRLVEQGKSDAVIALGAVIRGETAHFEFISAECARGLQQAGLDTGVPVAFGVLTTEDRRQAELRADPAGRNKGREAALAALEMIALTERLSRGP